MCHKSQMGICAIFELKLQQSSAVSDRPASSSKFHPNGFMEWRSCKSDQKSVESMNFREFLYEGSNEITALRRFFCCNFPNLRRCNGGIGMHRQTLPFFWVRTCPFGHRIFTGGGDTPIPYPVSAVASWPLKQTGRGVGDLYNGDRWQSR